MDFKQVIGLGIAGNFAGHLEQAGEAKDFEKVAVAESQQPKAVFPFYVRSEQSGFLATYPVSNDTILVPAAGGNIQLEPEVALHCQIHYDGTEVTHLTPLGFAAFNDCSIRRPNAIRISEKKNWGTASKGMSPTLIAIDHFAEGGVMDQYRIASFIKRDGDYIAYGVDSPVTGYNYFHEKLLAWVAGRLNDQADAPPMESIATHLKNADYPSNALIGIGATRYTEFGESHFLQAGDQSIVLVYDGTRYTPESIAAMLRESKLPSEHISILIQDVVKSQ